MLFMHDNDPATNHERALRTLSIQHRLHIGGVPRSRFDDGDAQPEAPRPAEVWLAWTLRTLFRRHRRDGAVTRSSEMRTWLWGSQE